MHMEWGYVGMLIDNDALWMVNIFFVRELIFLHETLGSCKPQTFLMLVILGLIGRQTLILQNQMLIARKICDAILVYTLPIRKYYLKIYSQMLLHVLHMKCTLQTNNNYDNLCAFDNSSYIQHENLHDIPYKIIKFFIYSKNFVP